MNLSKSTNTNNRCSRAVENFFRHFKHKHHVHKNTILEDFNPFRATKCLWVGIKFEKWPWAYVCSNKICLTCRAMFLFALGDRYDPNKASKCQQSVCASCRKFFQTIQTQVSCLRKCIFWGIQPIQSQKSPLNGYEMWKMAISLRLCMYNPIEVSCDVSVCFGR